MFEYFDSKYLGVPKSSGGRLSISYRRLAKIFFFNEMIEKTKLYFSVLFHPYSTGITIIEFRQELFLCKISLTREAD